HYVRVLFPGIRDANGSHGHRDLGRRLLLGALDARFDLANVLEVLVEPDAIARAQPALERGDIAGHGIEDAAVLPHARDTLLGRARTSEHALEHDTRVRLHRQ